MSRSYKTFMLSDEPKLFGIPIISGLPCIALTIVGLMTNYTFQLFVVGVALSFAMHFTFSGKGIRIFFSVVYWKFPKKSTSLLLRRSPDSSKRIYLK